MFGKWINRYKDWKLERELNRSYKARLEAKKRSRDLVESESGIKDSVEVGDLIFYRMDDNSLQIDFINDDLHHITVVPGWMESSLIDFIMGVKK